MHNPQLKRWLGCIAAPTLVLWGAADGIVAPAYGEAYASLIPGARFESIAEAGHHPEIEQPAALAERVIAFMQP
jgi:pimeloyl-ACP methyl ester carboxylesterase